MKNLTKALSIIIVMALVLVAPMSVFAAANPGDIPPEWQIEQNSDVYSEGHTLTRSTLSGTCSISVPSGGTTVYISATTNSTSYSSLTVGVKLEYYKNGQWVTYPGSKTYSNSNGFGQSVTASGSMKVASGYYYRASGIHGGTGFSPLTSTSSSLYI